VTRLRLLSYLAPSIPEELFELVAAELRAATRMPVDLAFETRVSGPSAEDDPFAAGRADLAFVCAPSYPALRESGSPVVLLPAAPVFDDPRAEGRPVYYSDVVVRSAHPASRFEDLNGAVWSYNDRRSRSGWFNMLARLAQIGHPGPPEGFFAALVPAGSHRRSLELVAGGAADAAAIDSNTLRLAVRREPESVSGLRVLESWGPMPIQPVLAAAALPERLRRRIAQTLLGLAEGPIARARLSEFGLRGFAPVEEATYASLSSDLPWAVRMV
jgi:phosphonate transport system substrate-binding protein